MIYFDTFVGDEVRIEGRDKVSGAAQYTADFTRPGALWAAFALSPHPRAEIRRIDTREAWEVAGVRAVLTGADIGLRLFGRQVYDMPVLAVDRVRFVGERVAAVAAETRSAAEDAARAIAVEYAELAPVLSVEAALAADAAILHPAWAEYYFPANQYVPVNRPHPNVQGSRRYVRGDERIEALFLDAGRVFEQTYLAPRQHAAYIEPRSTLVWIDAAGTVHVLSPNKSPFALRGQLARVAGIDAESIVVETSAIGGDFGGKGLTIDEFPCYFLAKATGRPVRYVQSYADELRCGPTRHRTLMRLKTAVAADGTLLAHHSTVFYDGGAYAGGKPVPWLLPGNGYASIPYRVPNVLLEMLSVYTNSAPAAHVRGPGEVQTAFAWEQHMDTIAAAIQIDPIELRLRNSVDDGEETLMGERVGRSAGRAVLETLRDVLAQEGPPPAGSGRGIAFTCSPTGSGDTSVKMRLCADGSVEVVVGVPDQGAGTYTAVRRIAAQALTVSEQRIAVRRGSTGESGEDPGPGHSRVTHIVGRATLVAAEKLRGELEARIGLRTWNDTTLAEAAARLCADGPLDVVGEFRGGFEASDHSFAAVAIDANVDCETGAYDVAKALLVVDVAQIINPVAHQGQLDGGFVFGLGVGTMEELPTDESGRITAFNLADYKIPTIADVPALRTVLVNGASGDGAYGTKMVGELSIAPVSAAVANAVFAASGARVLQFPVTSERVFDELCTCIKKESGIA